MNESGGGSGLKPTLNFPGVLGQSIASIGLTASVAVNIPIIYGIAGAGTWITYLVATVAILLVALNINQFAGKFASSGGLSVFVKESLGPWAGIMTAWALTLAYVIVGMCVLAGFSESVHAMFQHLHLPFHSAVFYVLCMAACTTLACWEVRFSALLMLVTEVLSVTVITILCFIILKRHGFTVDFSQITLQGVSFSGVRSGLVLAVLSFTAFESATTLGNETNNPLKTIPRAVFIAPLVAGIFFIFAAYVLALAFHSSPVSILTSDDPLELLARQMGLADFAVWIAFGASVCFFGAALANLTAAARIIFFLARKGYLPKELAVVHKRGTPQTALITAGLLGAIGAMTFAFTGCKSMELFNYTGTVATFGFLVAYFLVSIGAPIYLYRQGELTILTLLVSVLSALFLLFVAVGSIYPVPPGPEKYLPLIFLGLFVGGGIVFTSIYRFSNAGNHDGG
ncbi:MAG: APC family permease [Chthoniobacterales bacterium]